MQMNLYNSVPVVIAKDIPLLCQRHFSKSMMLPGMGIEVGEKRVYLAATASQLSVIPGPSVKPIARRRLRPLGYQLNDTIGKDGIELVWKRLTANAISRQGRRVMEKDSSGRLTSQLDYMAPWTAIT